MVSLYESSHVSIEPGDGVSICRPGKEVLNKSAVDGLTFFSPRAGIAIGSRADIQSCKLEFFCIGQIVSGDGWYWTEAGGRMPVSSYQIFFIRPGKVHDLAAGKSGMVVDQIFFCGSLAEALFNANVLLGELCDVGTARRLLPIIEHASMGTPEHRLRAVSGLTGLLADLTSGSSSDGTLPEESQVERLCAELKRKPEKWWDGAQMAVFCNLSEAHLRRLFKARTGLSPKAYHDQVRVEKAAELLKNGFSVRLVSEILGYADPYHFSRRFKSILGYSPRDCISP